MLFPMSGANVLWNDLFAAESAQTTASWFLMSSPLPSITIFSFYVLVIKIIGPRLMTNLMPSELKKTLTLYHILQVVYNAVLVFLLVQLGCLKVYSSECNSLEFLSRRTPMLLIAICWLYFLGKFLNMFESLFLLLQKRSNDISIMSLFYEGFVLLSVWFVVRFIPGRHVSLLMLVDASALVLKHLYYLITQKKPIPGSQFLLALHLMQSIVIFVHAVEMLTWNRCNFPTPFIGLLSIQSVLLFLLLRSKCKQNENRRKQRKETESDDYYDYNSNAAPFSFNNYRLYNSEVTKRYSTTLKSQA